MRLNRTEALVDDHEFPATSDELIDAYGDVEIELQDGTETVATVLGRLGAETYQSSEDVRDALRTGVSHKAIGRRFYSDRDAYAIAENGPEQVSF